MRPALGVLLICALTPLAAGCGAGDDVKSAVDPVAQAATNTQNAGSVAIAMSGGASAAGQEIPLQGEGVFDLKGKRGRFTMTTSVPGQQGVKIEEIVDGLVLYMHSDALAKGAARRQDVAEDRSQGGRREAGRRPRPAAVAQRRRRPDAVPELPGQGRRRPEGRHRGRQRDLDHPLPRDDRLDKLAGTAGKAADSVRQLEQIDRPQELPTDI